jgi:hypothetical protein
VRGKTHKKLSRSPVLPRTRVPLHVISITRNSLLSCGTLTLLALGHWFTTYIRDHSRLPNLSIARLVGASAAQHMYTGAIVWLVAIITTPIFPLLSNTESAKAFYSACITAEKIVRADHREDLVQLPMYQVGERIGTPLEKRIRSLRLRADGARVSRVDFRSVFASKFGMPAASRPNRKLQLLVRAVS